MFSMRMAPKPRTEKFRPASSGDSTATCQPAPLSRRRIGKSACIRQTARAYQVDEPLTQDDKMTPAKCLLPLAGGSPGDSIVGISERIHAASSRTLHPTLNME